MPIFKPYQIISIQLDFYGTLLKKEAKFLAN